MAVSPQTKQSHHGARHMLITGASAGIGAALAKKAANTGWVVSALARRTDKLEALAEANPNILPVKADVSDLASCEEAVRLAVLGHGPIDVAVLNAGIYHPQTAPPVDVASFEAQMDVNYMGMVRMLSHILPDMAARGAGHIALMGSVAGYRGLPQAAAYSPTKAAAIALAESLNFDLEPKGIKIQIINPGFVETDATSVNDFDMPDIITSEQAAIEILRGLASDRFEIAFPKRFVRQMKMLKYLTDRLYFKIMRARTGK